MQTETKTCQNCKAQFGIDASDFAFYEKIHVPPPTWCPECRMQRRFMFRNERVFYRTACAHSGKNLISGFDPSAGIVVYDRNFWWSDGWDPTAYGVAYDFTKPLFAQYKKLMHTVPMPAVFNARTVGCDYVQHVGDYKNAYLVSASWSGENVMYGTRCNESKDCTDALATSKCELCYEIVSATHSYRMLFSQNSDSCTDCAFVFECRGCTNCFGCTNLRNKSYYVFNKPYSKEDYFRKLHEFDLGSYASVMSIKQQLDHLKLVALRKFANNINTEAVTGDNVRRASHCMQCFDVVSEVRNCKFVQNALGLRDSYDGYGVGAEAELLYEVFDSGVQGSRQFFGGILYGCMNTFYSYNCHNCSNLFACIGLRNKSYCILNTQYTKEAYEALVPKIIEHMNSMPYTDAKGRVYRYGEFFPPDLSPFCYNETIAQEYFPLTKEQALEQGYRWKDPEERTITITMTHDKLPDHIKDVSDDIVNQIIGCRHAGTASSAKASEVTCNEQCTKGFKIIEPELQFYRKMNLPLPRLCPNCRHYARLRQRNPLKLWRRQCMCAGTQSAMRNSQLDNFPIYTNTATHHHGAIPCPEEFETSYSPERQEIVYCESCYNSEIA